MPPAREARGAAPRWKPRPTRWKRASPNCATPRPSWKRCARAHYAANDVLHKEQGALAEAALDVSRLEERIRYVVEGRQRAQQRLADLKLQNTQWSERQAAAHAELEDIAAQIEQAEEQSGVLAAQAEEEAQQLPTAAGTRCAPRRPPPTSSARWVAQVQQQIQVLAAESRSVEEQQRGHEGPA